MEDIYTQENRIENLKRRAKRCVCKNCGGELSLRRIVFNDIDLARVEIYCEHCQRIEFGVEPEIYACASGFVDSFGFNYYEDLDRNEQARKMNIAKVSEILSWSLKNMGLLTNEGFSVDLKTLNNSWAEILSINEENVAAGKKFDEYVEELFNQ